MNIKYSLLYAVCETAGYLVSFWNRPLFPEWCSRATFDDTKTFDTMVRIAGSYFGFAWAFKAVVDLYGWTHIVLVSDDNSMKPCWFGSKPMDAVFSNDRNYTFTWLRLGADPTDEQLDSVLLQIRSLTRGFTVQISFSSRVRVAQPLRARYCVSK